MKNIIKSAALSVLAVAGITMASCSSDTVYDVVGNPNNLVYFKANANNTFTGTVAHTPVGDFGSLKGEFPVKVQRAPSQNCKVYVVSDPSLVEAYNAEHNTSYVALPESAVTFENQNVTVEAGKTDASDTVKVTLNESALASLTEKAYMMAVKIGSAEGELKGSEERGVGYLIVNTETKLVNDSPSSIIGTMADASTFTAVEAENMDVAKYADMFAGGWSARWPFTTKGSKASFVVDI